jgi:hypothetical protein
MLVPVRFVCLTFAFVCFVLSALNVPSPRVNLQAAGLAFWLATVFLL